MILHIRLKSSEDVTKHWTLSVDIKPEMKKSWQERVKNLVITAIAGMATGAIMICQFAVWDLLGFLPKVGYFLSGILFPFEVVAFLSIASRINERRGA